MAYETRIISDVNNKNIKLGKTFKYSLGNDSNYNLTNIYYINENQTTKSTNQNSLLKETESKKQESVDDKTKLIIQTPLMYIPNSMIYFNEKPFLELSFNNEDNDKDVLEFKKWIINLEDYIFKLIKKRSSLNIEKNNLCSVLKVSNNGRANRLIVPINTNISKCILNDDCNNKKSKILFNWEIPVPTYGISIIWVKNLWIKNGKWGINLFMYASRVMNSHILDPIEFMDLDNTISNKNIKSKDIIKQFKDNNNASIQIGQVPEYAMYFRMLKMGIPKDAVKQKMSLLNLDTRYIDYPDTTPYITVMHYISNPNLGPYVKPKNNNLSLDTSLDTSSLTLPPRPSIQLNLLNNISNGGFKLKKVNINENTNNNSNTKDKIVSGLMKSGSNMLKVPSLGDIQSALAKLKKVDLDCDSEI